MRFSVDAHAIGQHLTGNETYIRNLLNCFAKLDRQADFVTYLSRETAFENVPERFFKTFHGNCVRTARIYCTFNIPRRYSALSRL